MVWQREHVSAAITAELTWLAQRPTGGCGHYHFSVNSQFAAAKTLVYRSYRLHAAFCQARQAHFWTLLRCLNTHSFGMSCVGACLSDSPPQFPLYINQTDSQPPYSILPDTFPPHWAASQTSQTTVKLFPLGCSRGDSYGNWTYLGSLCSLLFSPLALVHFPTQCVHAISSRLRCPVLLDSTGLLCCSRFSPQPPCPSRCMASLVHAPK